MVEKIGGLTSVQAAIITTGDNLGLQLGPITAGFLLCSVGHMSIIYSVLAACLVQFIVLILIAVIVSELKKKPELPPVSLTD